jgi:hypothetical protein
MLSWIFRAYSDTFSVATFHRNPNLPVAVDPEIANAGEQGPAFQARLNSPGTEAVQSNGDSTRHAA